MNIGRDAMGVMGETERRASRSMRSLITDLCGFRRRNKARLSDYRQSVEAQLSRGGNGEAKRHVGGRAPNTRLLPPYDSFDWWPLMLSTRQVVGHGTRAL